MQSKNCFMHALEEHAYSLAGIDWIENEHYSITGFKRERESTKNERERARRSHLLYNGVLWKILKRVDFTSYPPPK